MIINIKQKITIIVCCFALFVSVIFPPWEYERPAVVVNHSRIGNSYDRNFVTTMAGGGITTTPAGYYFIFTPPSLSYNDEGFVFQGIRIDLRRMMTEWACIVSLSLGLIMLFSLKTTTKIRRQLST